MEETTSTPARPEAGKPRRHRRSGWEFGLILILVGAFLMLQRTSGFRFDNWWAFFILLPAFGSFRSAWDRYQAQGRKLTRRVIEPFMAGLFFTAVTAFFLFNIDWSMILPVLLILFGVGILSSTFLK